MTNAPHKTGWVKDTNDPLDYYLDDREIGILFTRIKIATQIINLLKETKKGIKEIQPSAEKLGLAFPGSKLIHRFLVSSNVDPAIDSLKQDIERVLDNIASRLDLIDAELSNGATEEEKSAERLLIVPPLAVESEFLEKINQQIEALSSPSGYGKHEFHTMSMQLSNQEVQNIQQQIANVANILRDLTPIAQYSTDDYDTIICDAIQKIVSNASTANPKDTTGSTVLKIKQFRTGKADVASARNNANISQWGNNQSLPIKLPLNRTIARHMIDQAGDIFLELPTIVDLSYWSSDIKDQGDLNACTSHAVSSMVEYFQNRHTLQRLKTRAISDISNISQTYPARLSARFLYKVSRRLAIANHGSNDRVLEPYLKQEIRSDSNQKTKAIAQLQLMIQSLELSQETLDLYIRTDVNNHNENFHKQFSMEFFDIGASIRQTLKALQLFGIPMERHWPYSADYKEFDREPKPFCYAYAHNYQAVKYIRLDTPAPNAQDTGVQPEKSRQEIILAQIKAVLAAGFPAVFGFLYDKDFDPYTPGSNNADKIIECPADSIQLDQLRKNHAEAGKNRNFEENIETTFGHAVLAVGYDDHKKAFLIQNSWGTDWGIKGYGWLSYEYVLQGLATDWWTLLNTEWVEVGNFGLDNQFGGPRITSQGGI